MDTQLILISLAEIKTLLTNKPHPTISDKWVPREEVKSFFGYGDTQMAAFEKEFQLVTSKVGKRKFYAKASIQEALEKCASIKKQ